MWKNIREAPDILLRYFLLTETHLTSGPEVKWPHALSEFIWINSGNKGGVSNLNF